MEVTEEVLRKYYESLRDDELIDFLLNSELTDTASSALKDVLAARGITKDRVKEYVTEKDKKKAELARPGIVTASLPKMWIGYIFAVVFFVYEVVEIMIDPSSSDKVSPLLWLIAIAGWIYWLFCVQRIHQVIEQFTNGTHPISPSKAFGFHFIPFYNFYWVFKWPNEISNFVNKRIKPNFMAKWWAGFFLFIAVFLGRAVDSSLALITLFLVGSYLNRKVHEAIKLNLADSITSGPNNPINQAGL